MYTVYFAISILSRDTWGVTLLLSGSHGTSNMTHTIILFQIQTPSSQFQVYHFHLLQSSQQFLNGPTADSLITSSLQYKCVHNFSEVYTCTIEPVRCNCTVPGASLVPRPRYTDQSQQSFDLHATL